MMGGILIDPGSADHVRSSALHEPQIIGVIDDAGGVGVLEIDGQREMMLGADEAAAIRSVDVGAHCFGLSASIVRMRSPWAIAMSPRCIPQPGRKKPSTPTSPPMR